MRTKLRCFTNTLITSIALTAAASVHAATLANCDEASLRTAISQGGTISIECDGVVSLTGSLVITNEVTLDATGRHVTISGGNLKRVFKVLPGASLTLVNLTVANGRSANGGGVLNEGNLTLIRCVVTNNVAEGRAGTNGLAGANGKVATPASPGMTPGENGINGEPGDSARGGGLLNLGTLVVSNSVFVENQVIGGKGGNAGFGGRAGYAVDGFGRIRACDAPGLPGHAGDGGHAFGAAFCNDGSAEIIGTTFTANTASGGVGGQGGLGGGVPCALVAVATTDAGRGGSASGGAWFNTGTLRIVNSLATRNLASGGVGGDAPEVVGNLGAGKGGKGGNAFGGAGASTHTNSLLNSTIAFNRAIGGRSGFSALWGGYGCPAEGADGGDAYGGALHVGGDLEPDGSRYNGVYLGLSTVWMNEAIGGHPTNKTDASCPASFLGAHGQAHGQSIASSWMEIVGSIVAGRTNLPHCVGDFMDGGYNLYSDGGVLLVRDTSLTHRDPILGPLVDNGGPTLTLSPLPGSPAIDAISDNFFLPITDQRGVPRPQGSYTDVGAVEATFLTIERLANSDVRLRYGGIPSTSYTLEATPRFGEPWATLEAKPAGSDGVVHFTPIPSNTGERLFRVTVP